MIRWLVVKFLKHDRYPSFFKTWTNDPLSPLAVKAGGAKSAAVAPGWEPWVFLDIFVTSSQTFWLLHMSLQETYWWRFHRSGLAKLRELYNRIDTVKRSWRVKQSSMYYTETAVLSRWILINVFFLLYLAVRTRTFWWIWIRLRLRKVRLFFKGLTAMIEWVTIWMVLRSLVKRESSWRESYALDDW